MRRLLAVPALAVLLPLSGLAGGCQASSEPKPEAKGDTAPLEARGEIRTGRIIYSPDAPAVKSVEAYLHEELQLSCDDGALIALEASPSVSREQLIAAAGKSVSVRVIRHEAKAPDPNESYPVEADGSPMKRAARHEVLVLEVR